MHGVVVAGTHSGCGKTTITLGLLAALNKKGFRVQPFKTGPDFIDTGLHTLITGRTSRNLDLWMCGRDYVIECLHKHSSDADVAVIEGVMGMYDGNISTADLAATLNLPVILVVDAYGMAESAGAVVKGFVEYSATVSRSPRPELAGVIFNRVASDRHLKRLKDSIHDVPVLGYLPRDMDFKIPHRHLGLVVAEEGPITKEEIDKLADAVVEHVDIETIMNGQVGRGQGPGKQPKTESAFSTPAPRPPGPSTPSVKIAVAYDKAFCFYYEDNIDLLQKEGAEILRFSPLSDGTVPDNADALYIGGGYPELYPRQLSQNTSMLESIRSRINDGMPVYGECGGFMYLTEGMNDFDNIFYPMVGGFPFKTKMTKKRARLGYREISLQEDFTLGTKGSSARGHEFHYSEIVNSAEMQKNRCAKEGQTSRNEVTSPLRLSKIYSVKDGEGKYKYDEGYKVRNALGSYIHLHFGSNPYIAKKIVESAREYHGKNNYSRTRQS
ncbi:MAG: cobyrinate a,c-diamide synthase [Nitrospiraceae bacterium]|nr:MAG: cobyrinate a,c-diamide synthase [Nitrospiraceae bacterium]